jgi:hypothetical protein
METVTDILLSQYGKKTKAGSKIECPFCGKQKFSINTDDTVGKCFHPDCEKSITAQRGGGAMARSKKSTHVQSKGCTLDAYCAKKKISSDFVTSLQISQITIWSAPALRIPYLDEKGQEGPIRHRTNMEKGDIDNRFKWKKGSKPTLYGLWRLKEAREAGYIVLVEGESDCHTLWLHNILAIGLPGANTWQEDWSSYFDGIEKIYTIIEPDAGGNAVERWLTKSAIKDRVYLVRLGEYEDASGLHVAGSELFRSRWDDFIKTAIPWQRYAKEKEEATKIENEKLCTEILQTPNILDLFYKTLLRQGVVGEEKIAKLLFLALVSRLLQKPVSITVKGPSSCGKSYLVGRVSKFFPESNYYELTAMSERSLAYNKENFEHRFIIMFEAAGVQGELADYFIRSLISENCLKYDYVDKSGNGMTNKRIEKYGPTGFIMTTTALSQHAENETRILSVTVNDSKAHTKEVMLSIAQEHAEVDLEPWHALQHWLEASTTSVHIPFMLELAKLIPPENVRLRRDIMTLKSLIEAHTILHQKQRTIEDEQIIAELDDYHEVRELVVKIMSQGVAATISPTVRETVNAIKCLLEKGEAPVTNKKVAKKLDIDASAASRRVGAAIRAGYIINMQEKIRQPADLQLGEAMPDDYEILPTFEKVAECMNAEEAKRSKAPSPAENSGKNDDQSARKPFLVEIGRKDQFKEHAGILEFEGSIEGD